MPSLARIAALVSLLPLAVPGRAQKPDQTPNRCPPATEAIFLPCQTDAGHVDTERVSPRFPGAFMNNGIAGAVHVRYVVDTNGRVAPHSLEIVESTHELFSASVRSTAPRWRFTPWTYHGTRVAVRQEEIFQFTSSTLEPVPFINPFGVKDSTPAGILRTRIGTGPERPDAGAATAFSEDELVEAQKRALMMSAKTIDQTMRITLCISPLLAASPVQPDSVFLTALSTPSRMAVRTNACPKSYDTGGMIQLVDSLGHPVPPPRPPSGWIRPFYLTVEHVTPWTTSVILVEIEAGGTQYRCGVRRTPAGWEVECREPLRRSITVW